MQVSEARLAANKANGALGKGPVSERGKRVSRRNSLKHGMTGAGVVLLEGDQAEVETRVEALHDELCPQSSIGSMLLRKIAIFSVRSERAAEQENAQVALRARIAVHVFDEERGQSVDNLFDLFSTDPSGALRNLRRMPEGVDRLIEAWRHLRRELDRVDRFGTPQMARAAQLSGVRHLDVHTTRFGDLTSAMWGEFHALEPHEGADLDVPGRREWARVALRELVDAQIAELQAHRKTLDFARIEQDRREAPLRATFDDSKEAELAKRYEADSDRGFYKALNEFRKVEAEAARRIKAGPDRPAAESAESRMGSFRATPPRVDRERPPAFEDDPMDENPVVKGSDGLPLSITRPLPPPA